MIRANVTEIKNRLSYYLRLVKGGEEIEIVERKTPLARIVGIGNVPESQKGSSWVKEMYDVLCCTWQGNKLTRSQFQRFWPSGGTAKYYKYVAGKNGVRGYLDQMGVIEPADGRGAYRYKRPLDEILQADADLWDYAQQMRDRSPTPERR